MAQIKIQNSRIENLILAIRSLNAKSNNNVAFKFKNAGKTLYNLSRTLKSAEENWQKVLQERNSIIEKVSSPENKGKELEGREKYEFTVLFQQELDEEVSLDVRHIKLSDLDLDNNFISPEVLSGLGDVVVDDSDQEEAKETTKKELTR